MKVTLTPRILAIFREWRGEFEEGRAQDAGLTLFLELSALPPGEHDIPMGRLSHVAALAARFLWFDADPRFAGIRAESQELLDWLREFVIVTALPGGMVSLERK